MYKILILLIIMFNISLSKELEKVSLQLHWLDQFQFAGYYMAKEKGFYKDAGLDVQIKKFNSTLCQLYEVKNKRATYSIGRPSLLAKKSSGKDIKLLSAIFQSSPLILLATNPGIKSIKDIKGKRVMATKDVYESAFFSAMLHSEGIYEQDIKIQEHSFDIDDLISGKTDLMAFYISNEPYLLSQKGIKLISFSPQNYGFDFYSDILFTSGDEIKNHKQRAINFNKASLKGWEYAFNNIEESVEVIMRKYNTQNKTRDALIYEANALKKLAYYKTKKIGNISVKKMQKIYDLYKKLNLVKDQIDFGEFIVRQDIDMALDLTKNEKAYLKNNPLIKAHNEKHWPPFNFNENGEAKGFSIDYMNILAEKLDIEVEYVSGYSWDEFMKLLQTPKLDVIVNISKNKERAKTINFTEPFYSIENVIYVHKNSKGFKSLQELNYKTIAMPKGFFVQRLIEQYYPTVQQVLVKDQLEALKLLSLGKVDACIGKGVVMNYIIENNMIPNIKVSGYVKDKRAVSTVRLGTSKDDIILRDILQKAQKRVTQEEINALKKKWFGIKSNSKTNLIRLTKEQNEYLKTKKELTVCVRDGWEPYEGIQNGKFIGISSDFLKILSKKLSTPIKLVKSKSDKENMENLKRKRCDIKPIFIKEAETFIPYSATDTYFKDDITLITRIEHPFFYDINKYKDKKFVISKEFLHMKDHLNIRFPEIKLVEVNSINDGLDMVSEGEAFAYINTSMVSAYNIQKNYYGKLKIVNKISDVEFGFGISKDQPILYDIFQKCLKNIEQEDVTNIINRWVAINHVDGMYKQLLFKIVFTLFIIVSAFAYRHYLLNKLNKKLKIKVQERTKELSTYFETMDDGLAVADTVTKKFLNCNSSFERLTGFTKKELMNMTIEDIHPKEAYSHTLDEFNKATLGETILAKAIPVLNKKRKEVTLCDISINSYKDENMSFNIGVFRDITNRLYMESQLRDLNNNLEQKVLEKTAEQNILLSLFDSGEVSIVRWNNDKHWSVKYISRNASIIFGYSDKELMNSLFHFENIVFNDDLERVQNEVEEAVEKNVDFFVHKPYRIKTKQGDTKWILDNTLIIRDKQGDVIEYLGYIVDVTELKEYESSLENLVKEKTEENIKQLELLQQQSRLAQMGEMISMIAHQWRQPLSSISSTIVGLQIDLVSGSFDFEKKEDSEKFIKHLDKKFKSVDRYIKFLSTTIDDFRNFFKPNKSKEPVKLTTPIRKALKIVEISMENKGIEMDIEFKINDELYLHQNEIMQVILNILKNSSDNFEEKKTLNPKIDIMTQKINNDYIIMICDNGGGVREDLLPNIFDPYFSTKDEKNGTGLGLYMSKIMIEEHHRGSLNIFNKNGGACCEIRLQA
ncbi:MAG: transporter substrate-binding domain-containing protein [Campylobacterota bacterium]|nr:transporter substrate-binding domain-containing protein [Campylobacterota bacterium]